MIDDVQMALERLAPKMEDYKKRMIFSQKEVARIVETRRMFETKLRRSQKRLEDFVHYIDAEKRLERLRNRRIKKTGTGFSETDGLLGKNIVRIYRSALHYFDEPVLVKDFAEYCIERDFYDEMREALLEKCLKHLRDTDLWVFCAQKLWEINDMEGARGLFLKCVGVNTDRRLLIEFFRLECLYAAKANEINEELGIEDEEKGSVETGEVALAVFRTLAKGANEAEHRECLEIAGVVKGLADTVAAIYGAGDRMGEMGAKTAAENK